MEELCKLDEAQKAEVDKSIEALTEKQTMLDIYLSKGGLSFLTDKIRKSMHNTLVDFKKKAYLMTPEQFEQNRASFGKTYKTLDTQFDVLLKTYATFDKALGGD